MPQIFNHFYHPFSCNKTRGRNFSIASFN